MHAVPDLSVHKQLPQNLMSENSNLVIISHELGQVQLGESQRYKIFVFCIVK